MLLANKNALEFNPAKQLNFSRRGANNDSTKDAEIFAQGAYSTTKTVLY